MMNPQDSEGNLMQVLTGILEDSVQTLKRIEKAVNDSTKVANVMLERLDLIDKKIESGFVAVVKKALPSLENKFIEKNKNVGGEMGDLTSILPAKLQQSMQILTIQELIKELGTVPGEKKKAKPKEETAAGSPQDELKKVMNKAEKKSPPPQKDQSAPEPEKGEGKEKDGDHLLKPSSFFGS